MKHLALIGTGYVGATGAAFAAWAITSLCLDIDDGKAARLQDGVARGLRSGLQEWLHATWLPASSAYAEAVERRQVHLHRGGHTTGGRGVGRGAKVRSLAQSVPHLTHPARDCHQPELLFWTRRPHHGHHQQAPNGVHFAVVSSPEFALCARGSALGLYGSPRTVVLGSGALFSRGGWPGSTSLGCPITSSLTCARQK